MQHAAEEIIHKAEHAADEVKHRAGGIKHRAEDAVHKVGGGWAPAGQPTGKAGWERLAGWLSSKPAVGGGCQPGLLMAAKVAKVAAGRASALPPGTSPVANLLCIAP